MKRIFRRGVIALLFLTATQTAAIGQPGEPIRFVEDPIPLRGWVSAEYLAWWMRGQSVGPLVTTNSSADPFVSNANTVVLFGGERINLSAASGARFTIGTWINGDSTTGVELSAFYLQPRHTQFLAASDANGSPTLALAHPLSPAGEGIVFASSPNEVNGSIGVTTSTRLLGAELNTVFNAWRLQHDMLELVMGLRYLDLQEDMQINFATAAIGSDAALFGHDSFNTRNHFYGAQVGARWTGGVGRFSFGVAGLIGLGATSQTVGVDGSNTASGAVAFPGTVPGFVYSQPTNIGQNRHTSFSAVPQVQVKMGYTPFQNVRLTLGYDFLAWTGVVRPGDQLDAVNGAQITPNFVVHGSGTVSGDGGARPGPVTNTSTFWAQGISAGIEFSW
jgi:hypothetical protein